MARGRKRRGISFGTVFILLITIAVIGFSSVLVPRIAGQTNQNIDAQQIVNVLSASLDLPPLTLSDIPIFQSATSDQGNLNVSNDLTQNTSFSTAPPVNMETPTATPVPAKQTFTLTAAGSMAFAEGVRKGAYNSESKTYDYRPILTPLGSEMTGDLCLATLENTVASQAKISDINVTGDVLDGLKAAQLDMLALGHEHIMDYGLEGLVDTISAVRMAGFATLGVNMDAQDALVPNIVTLQGVKVAILHYTDLMTNTGKKKISSQNSAYAVSSFNMEKVAGDITGARSQGAQVVIVSLHWGSDSQTKATNDQREMAQHIADAGADVLLGANSLAALPIEYLTGNRADGTKRPTLVCYSLGTLITDDRSKSAYTASMLLHLKITHDPVTGAVSFDQVQFTPTYIWRYKEDGKYQYRVVASDLMPPEGMDESQQKAMQKALEQITNLLAESPAKIRTMAQ